MGLSFGQRDAHMNMLTVCGLEQFVYKQVKLDFVFFVSDDRAEPITLAFPVTFLRLINNKRGCRINIKGGRGENRV